MPLIRYTQYIFNPGGGPAANVPVSVMLLGGNVTVPLFTDKAGTLPLPNPVMTDGDGMVSFHAAPGDYTVWYGGTVWFIVVDDAETDPAWPGTFVHDQVSPATVWTVGHHFGVEPTVSLVLDGQSVAADVTHPDAEHTTITFSTPISGVAYLRR